MNNITLKLKCSECGLMVYTVTKKFKDGRYAEKYFDTYHAAETYALKKFGAASEECR